MQRRYFALRHAIAVRRLRFAMPIVAMPVVVLPVVVLAAAACLSGCGSISQKFAESASQLPAIGLPAGAPERPSTPVTYPAVHDIPPPRNSVVLTNVEAEQLESDLATARDQQQSAVGLPPAKKKKEQPSQRKIVPVSSRGSIY